MNPPPNRMPHDQAIAVGATEELSLRVSVATLIGVLFEGPDDGRTMLALERTATLGGGEGPRNVAAVAKPFGGGVRLTDPAALRKTIGDFRYDSQRSRQESDFRLQIRPASWEAVKEVCRDHFLERDTAILDSTPQRELAEEFADALDVSLAPDHYRLEARGMVIENVPGKTSSVRAAGRPTVRIYYTFHAWLQAPEIVAMVLESSGLLSDRDLRLLAERQAARRGRGRANAVLVVDRDQLAARYLSMPEARRSGPLRWGKHRLTGSVAAILDEVDHPRYRRFARPAR